MNHTNDTPDIRVIQVIESRLSRRGSGRSTDDPVRVVREYFTLDGTKLAESDDFAPTHCNAVGHRVMPGHSGCSHCGATLKEIVRAAGLELAEPVPEVAEAAPEPKPYWEPKKAFPPSSNGDGT